MCMCMYTQWLEAWLLVVDGRWSTGGVLQTYRHLLSTHAQVAAAYAHATPLRVLRILHACMHYCLSVSRQLADHPGWHSMNEQAKGHGRVKDQSRDDLS